MTVSAELREIEDAALLCRPLEYSPVQIEALASAEGELSRALMELRASGTCRWEPPSREGDDDQPRVVLATAASVCLDHGYCGPPQVHRAAVDAAADSPGDNLILYVATSMLNMRASLRNRLAEVVLSQLERGELDTVGQLRAAEYLQNAKLLRRLEDSPRCLATSVQAMHIAFHARWWAEPFSSERIEHWWAQFLHDNDGQVDAYATHLLFHRWWESESAEREELAHLLALTVQETPTSETRNVPRVQAVLDGACLAIANGLPKDCLEVVLNGTARLLEDTSSRESPSFNALWVAAAILSDQYGVRLELTGRAPEGPYATPEIAMQASSLDPTGLAYDVVAKSSINAAGLDAVRHAVAARGRS